MPDIELHPEAIEWLDRSANEIRQALEEIPREPLRTPNPRFEPDILPSGTLTEDDVRSIPYMEYIDQHTRQVVRVVFDTGTKAFQLSTTACRDLTSLSKRLASRPELRTLVGTSAIRRTLLLWLQESLDGADECPSCSDHLLDRLPSDIEDFEVWIPIAFLSVESELSLGRVTFKAISAALFDDWQRRYEQARPESERDAIRREMQRRRQRMQGLAAATLRVHAERDKAIEIALEAAERSTALLRFFSPETCTTAAASYIRPLGHENFQHYEAWILRPDGSPGYSAHKLPPYPVYVVLSDEKQKQLNDLGLRGLQELAATEKPSDLQKRLLDALLIYSRSVIARDAVDKLVYVLVALESMLLRNNTEAIQQNAGERLAFAVGATAQERQRIATLVRNCYSYRSEFLHHGQTKEDREKVGEFLEYSWRFFRELIVKHQSFESKAELIDALDARKFE